MQSITSMFPLCVGTEVVMTNGDIIPLPVKRYKEIRDILLQEHEHV